MSRNHSSNEGYVVGESTYQIGRWRCGLSMRRRMSPLFTSGKPEGSMRGKAHTSLPISRMDRGEM